MKNVLTVHPLTMLAARREEGISSWIGDSFGGCMPIRAANLSTYQAEPMPITSEMVFPKAAAAIVESTITLPSIISICSP
jgi:hypothetical protein